MQQQLDPLLPPVQSPQLQLLQVVARAEPPAAALLVALLSRAQQLW